MPIQTYLVHDANGQVINQRRRGTSRGMLTFYDGYDRPIATLDESGALKVQVPDAMGRPAETSVYGATRYLDEDVARAATQYATPTGFVSRSLVPKSFADSIRQVDRYGRVEYLATTPEQVAILNRTLETLPQREAITRWFLRGGS